VTCYLLSRVARQVEDENRKQADPDARHDQIDRVEECFAARAQCVQDVGVRLGTAIVLPASFQCGHSHHVPLDIRVELAQIDSVLVQFSLKVQMLQIDLFAHVRRRQSRAN
jgi:hypothetical protein